MDNSWIYDQDLSHIDMEKLKALTSAANQGKNLSQKELLPFLMAAASHSNQSNLQFSSEEMQTIFSVLKKNKSPEEQNRMDRIFRIMQQMQKKRQS